MKIRACMTASILVFSPVIHGDDRVSVGLGIGAPYAGIGANIALASEKDFKFLAIGCVARYESSDGSSGNACGVGIGWLRTDWVPTNSGKHAVGIYAGPVSARRPHSDDIDTVYGMGVNYTYFFRGPKNSGFQIGVTPVIGRKSGDTVGNIFMSLGYQF